MPLRVGGDLPDPIDTETEYIGKLLNPNSVSDRGPDQDRELSPSEVMRLGRLTGQEEDIYAPAERGFMHGVDSNFPDDPDLAERLRQAELDAEDWS